MDEYVHLSHIYLLLLLLIYVANVWFWFIFICTVSAFFITAAAFVFICKTWLPAYLFS